MSVVCGGGRKISPLVTRTLWKVGTGVVDVTDEPLVCRTTALYVTGTGVPVLTPAKVSVVRSLRVAL